MRRAIATGLGGLLLALPGGAGADSAGRNPDHPGYPLYVRLCSGCHGRNADGRGPQAAKLPQPPSNLVRLSVDRGRPVTLQELTRVIDGRRAVRSHGNDMPVWGNELAATATDPALRERTRIRLIQSLAEYVISIQEPLPTETP